MDLLSRAGNLVKGFRVLFFLFDRRIQTKLIHSHWTLTRFQNLAYSLMRCFQLNRDMPKEFRPGLHFWYYQIKDTDVTSYSRYKCARSIADNVCLKDGIISPLYEDHASP